MLKKTVLGRKTGMREYLISFFDEFGYDSADTRCYLEAYDAVVGHSQARTLLEDALAAYEADIHLDYQTEVLDRAQKIAELSGVHSFTAQQLVFMCMTKHLRECYLARGLDMQIFRDSVLDLKWKNEECKAVKGICGSFVAGWYPGFFDLTRFALGRLQFELTKAPGDYRGNGLVLEKGKSTLINVHIPRTGTPMDKESCDRSYAAAREFFKAEAGEDCPFVCHSWLLYPENKDILPASTNTVRFLSEYEIVAWGFNDGEDLWRLFDTEEKDPEKLPTNGTLRRCYAEHLKKGGRVGWGYGIKF